MNREAIILAETALIGVFKKNSIPGSGLPLANSLIFRKLHPLGFTLRLKDRAFLLP